MIDPSFLKRIADTNAMLDRLIPRIVGAQKSAELAAEFTRSVDAMSATLSSVFDKVVLQFRASTFVHGLIGAHEQLIEGMERHNDAHILVSAQLPKLGWYRSREEPCTLSIELADFIRDNEWGKVDQEMMKHLPRFKTDELRQWLGQRRSAGAPH